MAKLDITLTKEAFDTLSDELKGFYTPTQDGKGYELEGIGSIQRALAEEKARKVTKPELVTELEELRQFKQQQMAAQAEAANKDLEAKGQYEEALAAKEQAWRERLDKETAEKTQLLTNLHREAAKSELIKRGALGDRVDYLAAEIVATSAFELGENGPVLKKKGGIGDATEFDSWMAEVKNAKPFFFESSGASGSGASGSGNAGAAAPRQLTKAEVKALDPAAKREFYLSGGEVTDAN